MTASNYDPQVQAMLDTLESLKARDLSELSPEEARNEDRRTTLPFLRMPEPVEKIENRRIIYKGHEIKARFYWPKIDDSESEQDLYSLIVYFHGGGWVVGAIENYDEICSTLANKAEAIVCSVDYRLAPEHKFPCALQDCFAATEWVAENANLLEGDVETLVVAGDSAGGTLAIDMCLMARENKSPQITLALPICPVTDLTRDLSKYSKDKFGPSKEAMDWFIRHYVNGESDLLDPLASPQFADLSGLPYTIMVAAELDPLREQELDFAKKLEESAVKAKLLDYPGMVHDFIVTPGYFPRGRMALDEIGLEIRELYAENAK